MEKVTFNGVTVWTKRGRNLRWALQKAGYEVEESSPENAGWRVMLGSGDVFALADDEEGAESVAHALRNAGIQTSVRVEPASG
jgi:hypothetical protein